jgi:alcohol dehydrogenase class IV
MMTGFQNFAALASGPRDDSLRPPLGTFRALPLDLVSFGPGMVQRVGEDLDRLGGRRVFVVTNRSIASNPALISRIELILGDRLVARFSAVRPHVPASDVFAAVEAARQCRADLLISFGGGSAIDCTKLVAFVLAGGAADADGLIRLATSHGRPEIGDLLPHIAISTTLSAAEFSCAAGVTDEKRRIKGVLSTAGMMPRVAVLDPVLTLATPTDLWASTGIKALDHAIERLCALDHQPLIDVLCIEAARLLIENLPASAENNEAALAARGHCQIGAWLSFYGWLNARTGLSHVLGHQIGARFGIPHGYTSCVTLPHVIRLVHAKTATRQLALLAHTLGLDDSKEPASAIADIVAQLVRHFALPSTLSALAVPEDELDALAGAAFEEMTASRRLVSGQTPDDVARIVQAAW